MKNYLKSTIACLVIGTFSFTSCLDMSSGPQDADASIARTVSQSSNIELGQISCDFDNRKTEYLVRNEIGFIMPGPGSTDQNPVFLIDVPGSSMRYTACNMPDGIKHNGMKIRFNGEKKMIDSSERWAGAPLKLTSIEIMEADPVITTSAVASAD